MGQGRAAVILERAKHRAGIYPIASRGQESATNIAAQIVAERGDGASVIKDVRAGGAGRSGWYSRY